MKIALFAALLLISSSAQASWIRISSSNPVLGQGNIFVATYLHDGPLDQSLLVASQLRYFLTVVYDLELVKPIIYQRSHSASKRIGSCHTQAERWALRYERKKRIRDIAERYLTDDPSEEEKE